MTPFEPVTSDPAMLNGQPCIRGMRLTVRPVLGALATYPDRQQFRAEFPEMEDEANGPSPSVPSRIAAAGCHWTCQLFRRTYRKLAP
jgi:hypothetical protein